MLNMQKIGGFISQLRKERDLTQVTLADELSVSHQAVSKWERGESLPDAATLIKLAGILGVSVDDILSGERRNAAHLQTLLKGIVESNPETIGQLMESGDASISELAEVAPILRPSDFRKLGPKLASGFMRSDDLIALAPFLDMDTLTQLITAGIALWTSPWTQETGPWKRGCVTSCLNSPSTKVT